MRKGLVIAAIISCNTFAAEMGPTGGLGGSAFKDPNTRINSIVLCGGSKIDSITTTYNNGLTYKHGGTGGGCSTIDFPGINPSIPNSPDLRLVKITGCFNGGAISSLTLIRADGQSLTKGSCSGSAFSYGSDPHP